MPNPGWLVSLFPFFCLLKAAAILYLVGAWCRLHRKQHGETHPGHCSLGLQSHAHAEGS